MGICAKRSSVFVQLSWYVFVSAAALELGDSVLVAKRPQNAAGRVSENSRLFVVSSPPRDYADHEEDNCDDDHDEEDNCDYVDDDKADVSVSMAEFSRKISNVCLSLSPPHHAARSKYISNFQRSQKYIVVQLICLPLSLPKPCQITMPLTNSLLFTEICSSF